MSGIPLPALSLQQQPDFVSKYMQERSFMGQQQLQQQQIEAAQMENEQRQQSLDDQKAYTAAVREWDGQNENTLPALIQKHGGSGQFVQNTRAGILKLQTDLATKKKLELENEGTQNNYIAAHIEAVKSLPPEQQPVAFEAAKTDLVNRGYLDPKQAQGLKYQGPEQLDELEKNYIAHTNMVENALKQADTREKNAQAGLADIKLRLSQNSKPGDFDSAIDSVADPTTNKALNVRTKALVNFALQRGDVESANQAVTMAAQQVGAIEKETNPAVMAARTQQAVGTEVATQRALAPALQQIVSTTRAGRSYISRDEIPDKSKAYIEQQAAQAGIPVVDKDTAGALTEIDTAKANQDYMLNAIGKKLATDPTGRIFTGPKNTIEKLAQSDPDLAAMGTFRNAAIQSMRAVAGSKGLRINQYEVQLAIDNDIPKMTDTLPVAQQKLKNLQAFLENSESAHLDRNRGQGQAGGGQTQQRAAAGFTRIKASDGSLHDIPTANLGAARKRDPGLQVLQ